MQDALAVSERNNSAERHTELIRDFTNLYFEGPDGKYLYETTSWLGVPALKCPLDLWIYQEIIFKTRPDTLIEAGVFRGGTTLYLASILDLIGAGRILACDVCLDYVDDKVRAHPRIQLFEGSSIDPNIVADIAGQCWGRRTMVILDSDHAYDHVLQELLIYSPLVTPGCYLICEDTVVNGNPVLPDHGPGPHEAVQEFLQSHPEWEADRDCERLLVTFNPSGYLRRTGGEHHVSGNGVLDHDTGCLEGLNRVMESAAAGASPHERFGNIDDEFWFWLNTEGYRRSPALQELLPGLPPEQMQLSCTGLAEDDTLKEAFGFYSLVKEIFSQHVEPLNASHKLLEFGCGWGRVLRFFLKDLPPGHLWGVDCYEPVMDFARQSNRWCTLELVPALPPTDIAPNQFDLVYVFSVFSHLSESAHRKWLIELKRLLKPGGLLIATTCGRNFIEQCDQLRTQDNLLWIAECFKEYFPNAAQSLADYDQGKYCYSPHPEPFGPLDGTIFGATCIPKAYVLENWTKEFEFIDFIEGQPFDQHVIVVRKPADAA
jgi:cephalosporin hydroxylase/SAM-dependent methyltransferase